MTSTLLSYFEQLKKKGIKAFVPYLVAGYPNHDSTPALIKAAEKAGAHAIELGIPFSDPVADGPILQKASFEALENKTTLDSVLEMLTTVSRETTIPILLMGYTNPFLQKGWVKLAQQSKKAGVAGFIIADLPIEETNTATKIFESYDLGLSPLCAPTTQPERIKKIAEACTGFMYLVALKGVTGTRDSLSHELRPFIKRVRGLTNKPLYVGFGVSNPEQARIILADADGVILGSRIASFLDEHRNDSNLDQLLIDFLEPWIVTGRTRAAR